MTRRRAPASERLFVVGDAAGYVEPFTGEGMAWALEGASALLPWLARLVEDGPAGCAAGWTRAYRRAVGRRQTGSRAVVALVRRPRLVATALGWLGRGPLRDGPWVRRWTQP